MITVLCRLLAFALEVRDSYRARLDGAQLAADIETWLAHQTEERTP